MKIKWLKTLHSGIDMGAVYDIVQTWGEELYFYDEFGRMQSVHTRCKGILYEEVENA